MTETEKKLLERPIEADTKVLVNMFLDFGEFKGLYEKWSWDGITASSVICLAENVKGKPHEEFVAVLFDKMKLPVDPRATYQVTGDYFFLNFGFEVC